VSRKGLDKKTTGDLVRLSIFMVITAMATGLLAATIGNLSFERTREYSAVFSDATGVFKGDDVRIAGVKVGTVKKVDIVNRTRARVTFSVRNETPLTEASHLTVKFRNLVGQRYIAVSQESGDSARLAEHATIPLDHTTPALDLTVLFNGFKPLFAALSPRDINKLSYEIVQVFQGEGGTLEGLLGDTASLTSTLADRDQVIGDLIDNLNTVLAHVADRDDELARLITSFRTLVSGLNQDRDALLGPLNQISDLSVQTAGLVKGLRPDLVTDLKQLRRLSENLDRNKGEIDRVLQVLPVKLNKMGRTAIYGSFFNFYLCEFHGRVILPGGQRLPIDYKTAAARCNL
jgi:phospholipid/cholesterol/gamma-HCH transport system substrate-binding protein